MSKKFNPSRGPSPRKKGLQKASHDRQIFPDFEDVTPIVKFLEDFAKMADPRAQYPSRLISLKVPEPLLAAFRFKAEQQNVPYQTMIKRLMLKWLESHGE